MTNIFDSDISETGDAKTNNDNIIDLSIISLDNSRYAAWCAKTLNKWVINHSDV